ncbi:hypothetical protein ACTJIJ_22845 [Niabella sp. 22666]|uniref:hypothetical protein n=1 Tax=Niabella sp. 22666 TaxID=3453954 RepID=UPI003F8757C8
MNKYKIKNMKVEMLEGIAQTIHNAINSHKPANDVEKMLFSAMGGLVAKFHDKLNPYKRQAKYTYDLTPQEAFGWRILYWNFLHPLGTSVGNTMRIIGDDIHRFYEKPENYKQEKEITL